VSSPVVPARAATDTRAASETPPASVAGALPAQQDKPVKSGDGAVEPIIPLVHAPDDPGPEPESGTELETGGKTEKRRSAWSLFR
jgi:hypothetical protein